MDFSLAIERTAREKPRGPLGERVKLVRGLAPQGGFFLLSAVPAPWNAKHIPLGSAESKKILNSASSASLR